MFLHHLRLENVGPFCGINEVDFASLSQAGLFLLEGPTGAGKSTIIDAIVFALYGQMASSESSVARMRAELASPADRSEVELVFETAAGIFRITRSPSYSRAKKQGQGQTVEQPKVLLYRLADPQSNDGELLSSRVGEAESEVLRIIGLNREQFVQTMVLPQGEFAAFLRATPQDRQELLQRLFGTQLYHQAADRLEQSRRVANAQRKASDEDVSHRITAFGAATNLTPTECGELTTAWDLSTIEDPSPSNEGSTFFEKLDEFVGKLALAKSTYASIDEVATRALNEATDVADAAGQTQSKKARLASLQTRDSALSEGASQHQAHLATRDRLAKLATVAPIFESLTAIRSEHLKCQMRVKSLREKVGDCDPFEQNTFDADTDFAALARKLRTDADQLVHLNPIEQALPGRTQSLDKLEQDLASAQRDLTTKQARLADLPPQIQSKREARSILRDRAVLFDARELALTAAKSSLGAATLRDQLISRLATAAETVGILQQEAKNSEHHLAALRTARIEGIAAELATQLDPGVDCPVCGSVDHPRPATPAPNAVAPADIDAAQTIADRALAELASAKTEHDEVDRQLTAATTMSGLLERDQAQMLVDQALVSHNESRAARESESQAEAEILELERRFEQEEAISTQLLQLVTQLTNRHEAQTTGLTEDVARVTLSRGDFSSISARISYLRKRAESIDGLAIALRERDHADSDLRAREVEWTATIATLGFADEQEYIGAAAGLSTLDSLSRTIDEFARESALVTDGLASPDLVGVDDLPDCDLDALKNEVTSAQLVQRCASQDLNQANHLLEQGLAHRAAIKRGFNERVVTYEQTAEVIRIAGIVTASSPDNLKRIPLPTFVLMEKFADVIAAANDRLATMSDGRYALAHSQVRESRGRKSGLGLEVMDYQTERCRVPGDLSGGERFYCALALALGLADVVTSEAGGVSLGTLFIDEGFGSLDTQTLDSVLTEISRLRDAGRVVGLVSHVEELKQRISDRICVRPTDTGGSELTVNV